MTATKPGVKQSSTPVVRISDPWIGMRQEMNDLISKFWNRNRDAPSSTFAPALDVVEKDNSFELHVDIPGIKAKDFDIQVQGNTVTVSGKRNEEKEEKGKTYHRVERRSGCFSRTITLPCDVAEKEVAAEYTNGVLNVVLPKSEKEKPDRITVKG